MTELQVIDNIKIEDMIYEIRGKQVICDSDLANIYKVETKRINEAVKNNPKKFSESFCFRISEEDYCALKSKISTSKNRGGSRKGHTVFTEEGCLMLGTVLKSDVAVNTTLLVIEAFVAMKKYISSNLIEQRYINNMVLEHNERIRLLEDNFNNKSFSNEIFYEGQIYDAYSLLLEILNSSKESIIIIDNFANKKLFDLLAKTDKKVTVYSKNIDEELINKYMKQYNNVTLIHNDSYHDRFIIIDKKVLYHCGSSFKDLGTKCFCISKIENQELIRDMLSIIKSK